jgi:membrane protease subunit (stomatin/prohibitin family)
MDLESLSVASISASKQSQYALEAQVAVAKSANKQSEVAGQIVIDAVKSAEPGKGGLLDTVA